MSLPIKTTTAVVAINNPNNFNKLGGGLGLFCKTELQDVCEETVRELNGLFSGGRTWEPVFQILRYPDSYKR